RGPRRLEVPDTAVFAAIRLVREPRGFQALQQGFVLRLGDAVIAVEPRQLRFDFGTRRYQPLQFRDAGRRLRLLRLQRRDLHVGGVEPDLQVLHYRVHGNRGALGDSAIRGAHSAQLGTALLLETLDGVLHGEHFR